MLASNLAKFILKLDIRIVQPVAHRSNNIRLTYFNGVKPSPILLLNTTSFEQTAFYATHIPYRSINSGNGRSLSFTCIRFPADVNNINTEIIDKHLEIYSKLPDQGVPYNDNFLTQIAYYACPKLSCDSSYYFNLAVDWLYTKNLAQPRGTLPGLDSHSSWQWSLICMYALAHKLDNKKLLNAVMDQWIESDAVHKCLPSLGFVAEVYSKLPANSPPRKYVSWVLYWITRQRRKDSHWVVDDIKEVMKKHPGLKNDLRKHLEDEKVCECVRDPRKVSRDAFHH